MWQKGRRRRRWWKNLEVIQGKHANEHMLLVELLGVVVVVVAAADVVAVVDSIDGERQRRPQTSFQHRPQSRRRKWMWRTRRTKN